MKIDWQNWYFQIETFDFNTYMYFKHFWNLFKTIIGFGIVLGRRHIPILKDLLPERQGDNAQKINEKYKKEREDRMRSAIIKEIEKEEQ